MPDSLEYFVRPFQSPSAHGRRVIASTPKGTRERATLTWGGKGDAVTDVKSRGGVNVVCCNEQVTETQRETETVNIASAWDPRSYITVRRALSIDFKKEETQSCFGEGWDQLSGVASGVKAAFASLAADIKSVQDDIRGKPTSEAVRWNLQGNTRQGGLLVNAWDWSGAPPEGGYLPP